MLMPIAGRKPAKEAPAKKLSARSQRKSAEAVDVRGTGGASGNRAQRAIKCPKGTLR
jgi:hypothetical protein